MTTRATAPLRNLRGRAALAGAVAAPLLLAACGGGGGGGGASFAGAVGASSSLITTTPGLGSSDPAAWSSTAEYGASTGLSAINAAEGYAQITTGDEGGAGVRVGVIDSGIAAHPDVPVATRFAISGVPSVDAVQGNAHGTHVAGIIGARRDGTGTHGVAYNAELVDMPATNYLLPSSEWDSIHYGSFWLSAAATGLYGSDVDVINMSWGGDSPNATLLSSMRDAADNGRIMVIAAGNDSAAEPSYPGRYAADAQVAGLAIVVVAVNNSGAIASFSNACGAAAAYCMAAPGVGINSTVPSWQDPTLYDQFSGTSMAAPHVSGAAAVLIAAFPGVSADAVVNRLLTTATDLGDMATFGHGMLNMQAALNPVGVLSVPISGGAVAGGGGSGGATVTGAPTVAQATLRIDDFVLNLPASLQLPSGAVAQLNEVIVLDEQGFPFQSQLGDRVVQGARVTGIERFYGSAPKVGAASLGDLGRLTFSRPAAAFSLAIDEEDGRIEEDGLDDAAIRFDAELGPDAHLRLSLNRGASDGSGFAAQTLARPAAFINGSALFANHSGWLRTGLAAQTGFAVGEAGSEGAAAGRVNATLFTGEDPETGVATDLAKIEGVARLGSAARLFLEGGVMVEDGAFLNTVATGFLGDEADGDTVYGAVGLAVDVGASTSLFGQYSLGRTAVRLAEGGLFTEATPILSDAFSFGVSVADLLAKGDAATLTFGQPLRALSGEIAGALPVAVAENGAVISEEARYSLAPEGRELFVEGAYRRGVGRLGEAEIAAFARRQPDHDRTAAPDFGLGARFITAF